MNYSNYAYLSELFGNLALLREQAIKKEAESKIEQTAKPIKTSKKWVLATH